MEIKMQKVPMPPTEAKLQEVVLLILRLPQLQELRVTLQGLEVKRGVEEDVEVVPQTIVDVARGLMPETPDVDFLLSRLELDPLPWEKDRHPLTTLMTMMNRVQEQGLYASAWYVTAGDGLDAYLANPRDTLPAWLFGVPVNYVSEDQLPDGKLVLVGSTTRHSIDATYGVTADIGG